MNLKRQRRKRLPELVSWPAQRREEFFCLPAGREIAPTHQVRSRQGIFQPFIDIYRSLAMKGSAQVEYIQDIIVFQQRTENVEDLPGGHAGFKSIGAGGDPGPDIKMELQLLQQLVFLPDLPQVKSDQQDSHGRLLRKLMMARGKRSVGIKSGFRAILSGGHLTQA
jgi:hypothetical protein